MLLRVAGHVVRAIWVVCLGVGREGTEQPTTNVRVHALHELHTPSIAAFLRDVLDVGLGILEEIVPSSAGKTQLVERIEAGGVVEFLAEAFADIGKGKDVGVKVDIVQLAPGPNVQHSQDMQELRMVLLRDVLLKQFVVVGLLICRNSAVPKACILHGTVGIGDLLQEELESSKGSPIMEKGANARMMHNHVAEAAG